MHVAVRLQHRDGTRGTGDPTHADLPTFKTVFNPQLHPLGFDDMIAIQDHVTGVVLFIAQHHLPELFVTNSTFQWTSVSAEPDAVVAAFELLRAWFLTRIG